MSSGACRIVPAMAKLPPGGRFCRAVYVSLTIERRSSRSILPARSRRCASTDRTAPRLDRPRAIRGEPVRPAFRCRRRRPLPRRPARPQRRRPPATSMRCWRMQGVEDPTERRKRSVQRGRGALDVLDELKIGLLSGNLDASHREPAARCRRQSEILLRRSRPRCRAVRDRASGRSRTGQGRTGLALARFPRDPAAGSASGPAGESSLRPLSAPLRGRRRGAEPPLPGGDSFACARSSGRSAFRSATYCLSHAIAI